MSGKRMILALAVGAALAAAAARLEAGHAPRHPLEMDGHDWARLAPAQREAYLAGFLAGAAAQQATRGRLEAPGARVAAEAARLRRSGALTFPLRENVYRSHLDDYYFYTDRRDQPLIQAIVEMHRLHGARE